MGDSVEGLTAVQADIIHYSCPHLSGQSFHHRNVSSWSPLSEAMQTTSESFLVLNVPSNGFQN